MLSQLNTQQNNVIYRITDLYLVFAGTSIIAISLSVSNFSIKLKEEFLTVVCLDINYTDTLRVQYVT